MAMERAANACYQRTRIKVSKETKDRLGPPAIMMGALASLYALACTAKGLHSRYQPRVAGGSLGSVGGKALWEPLEGEGHMVPRNRMRVMLVRVAAEPSCAWH